MIKAELQGFNTQSRGNVIVTIGGNAEINLFNAATINRAYDAYIGATYWSSNGTSDPFASQVANAYNSTYGRLNEILNPRIWRLGARFEF